MRAACRNYTNQSAHNYTLALRCARSPARHLWSKRLGDSADQCDAKVASDGAGGMVVGFTTTGQVDFGQGLLGGAGQEDACVARLDSAGLVQWGKCFGGTGSDWIYDVAVDAWGDILLTGHFEGSVSFGGAVLVSGGGKDVFVVKLSAGGTHLWSFGAGAAGDDIGGAIAIGPSGEVVVAGQFAASIDLGGGVLTSAGGRDLFVGKLDQDGSHLWSKRYGDGQDQCPVEACIRSDGVALDGAGNVAVTAHFAGSVNLGGGALTSAGGYDILVGKLGPSGAHAWSKRFGDGNKQAFPHLAVDPASGAVFVVGAFYGSIDLGGGTVTNSGLADGFITRFEPGGAHGWTRHVVDGYGYAIAADASGRLVVTGPFEGAVDLGGGVLPSAGGADLFLARLDPATGAHLWSRRYGGSAEEVATSVALDPSGNVLLAGQFLSSSIDLGGGAPTNAGNGDVFVAKLGP